MASNYEVVDVFWRTSGFTIQVVRIPEDALDDKLAVLSTQSGLTKVEYDNFLIQKSLVDVERIGRFIATESNKDESQELILIEEIIGHVIEVNPLLNPELLIVTGDGLVKIAREGVEGKRLVDTQHWTEFPQPVIDTILDDMDASQLLDSPPEDVDVTLVPVEWPEVDLVVKVYKFRKKDLEVIFGDKKNFFGPVNYKMYVVRKCILDFSGLMILLDSMGITQEIAVPQIADKLFSFAMEVNPFLDMHELKESGVIEFTRRSPPKKKSSKKGRSGRASTKSADSSAVEKDKKKEEEQKEFSSVTKQEILALPDKLKKQVIGQAGAIDALVEAIEVASCGLRDPAKPIGCFLFTGETGVGKTHTAKILAKELCGSEENLVRIDCSEYGHGHEVAKLIGAPPGYLGHDAGGHLTNKVSDNPFSIILFDEIEKAHSKVYDILLQILDDGILTDGKGETADFSSCIVILTSNIGVKNVDRVAKTVGFGDVSVVNESRKASAIDSALKKHFKPEFLNRLDNIITFNSLGTNECGTIIGTQLDEINGYLREKQITLSLSTAAKRFILKEGFSKAYGARHINRTIEKQIIKPLARQIMQDLIKENSQVKVDYSKKSGISFKSEAIATSAMVKVKKDS